MNELLYLFLPPFLKSATLCIPACKKQSSRNPTTTRMSCITINTTCSIYSMFERYGLLFVPCEAANRCAADRVINPGNSTRLLEVMALLVVTICFLKIVSFNCYIILAILLLSIVGSQPFRWSTRLCALGNVFVQVSVIVPTLDKSAVAPWDIG
jgi:hypothetical protein